MLGQTHGKKVRIPAKGQRPAMVAGIFDALSALAAASAGHEILFLSGYGVSAALLGRPDVGLLTQVEMRDVLFRISRVVSAPVLVDADTGYGGTANVARTVEELEVAGAAGVFLEDQVWPKRCGHMSGKRVVPVEEHVERLQSALAARRSRDFVIVARTDAVATHGIDEAISRGVRYREAGADVIFIEAPESAEQVRRIGREVGGPLLLNLIEGGRTSALPVEELAELGFSFVLRPLTGLYAAARALVAAYGALGPQEGDVELMRFADFNRLIGVPQDAQ